MRLWLLAVTLLMVPITLAQEADVPHPNLELRLQPEELKNGIPQSFTFLLVNISDHDVYVAKPLVDCSSPFVGSLWLQLNFTPLNIHHKESGFGCSADNDSVGFPIKDRVQSWAVLHAGEISKQTVGMQGLHYDDKGPGRYEFWAEYDPPAINKRDQDVLKEAKIDFPRAPLTTVHLVYRKTR